MSKSQSTILIVTQKVDRNDDVLGFFHGWIQEFSKHYEKVTVICLEKGEVSLPSNVAVFSLGKERASKSRFIYAGRFIWQAWRSRRDYKYVFVHMNSEYLLLAGLMWRLFSKKIALWYNHTYGTFATRVSFHLAHGLFHTSPYAFSADLAHSIRMPAGIDTDQFKPSLSVAREENTVLYIGRIAPIKRVDVLIKAVDLLGKEDIKKIIHIYGEAIHKDFAYEERVKKEARPLLRSKQIFFHGKIPNSKTPEIYQRHSLFVNLTPRGNYDKTVLEAAASGMVVIASSEAFADFLPKELRFKEGDSFDLAEKIRSISLIPKHARDMLASTLREYAVSNHDTKLLASRVAEFFKKDV